MKALSIRQPWAWLIVQGFKDIENRTRASHYRGPLLIHASATMTKGDYEACRLFLDATFDVHHETEISHYHWTIPRWLPNGEPNLPSTLLLPSYHDLRQACGGIVGQVTMTDCHNQPCHSPWYTGDFGYAFTNAKTLPFRPYKGMLGFFNVSAPTAQLPPGKTKAPSLVSHRCAFGMLTPAGQPSPDRCPQAGTWAVCVHGQPTGMEFCDDHCAALRHAPTDGHTYTKL